jgi:hypothetical protein
LDEKVAQIGTIKRPPAFGRAPAALQGEQMAEHAHNSRGTPFMRQAIAFRRMSAPGGLLVLAPAGALFDDQA